MFSLPWMSTSCLRNSFKESACKRLSNIWSTRGGTLCTVLGVTWLKIMKNAQRYSMFGLMWMWSLPWIIFQSCEKPLEKCAAMSLLAGLNSYLCFKGFAMFLCRIGLGVNLHPQMIIQCFSLNKQKKNHVCFAKHWGFVIESAHICCTHCWRRHGFLLGKFFKALSQYLAISLLNNFMPID